EIKHVAFSPNGKLQALFRVVPQKKEGGGERKVIEVVQVDEGRKVTELDVTKVHGDWYFDPTFGPPTWRSDSSALVYTAEAPAPEPPKTDSKQHQRPFAKKFDYTPDFGETFIGKKEPTLFLLDLSSDDDEDEGALTVHRLTDLTTLGENGTVFGQPAFLPTRSQANEKKGEYHLVATAYSPTDDQRKLGIVYCQNRRARICLLRIRWDASAVSSMDEEESAAADGKGEKKGGFRVVEVMPISPAERSARSPRVQRFRIVYVSNTLGGVHASCAKLQIATLALSPSSPVSVLNDRTLVPVVQTPTNLNGVSDFPGLYIDQLPAEPFLHLKAGGARREEEGVAEGTKIVFTSGWRSRRVPLMVDLESGEIENLAPWPSTTATTRKSESGSDDPLPYLSSSPPSSSNDLSSYSILGTDGRGKVLATRSAPVTRALDKIEYTLLPLPKHEPTELILVSPCPVSLTTRTIVPPLLVQPHGGPHSQAVTEFSYSRAAAVLHGYRFVDVNYPGSTGFGQKTIDDLPPLLGTLEVEATLAAGRHLAELGLASRERNKTLLTGGSHGGWTACHLTARWPSEYGAVVMRNPVTDLVANASMTDIPDWCYEEAGIAYSLEGPPSLVSPEDYRRFYEISPMRHAHRVTTPTLLLIGMEDRRVPPNQGRA
ncbi:alpha/beta-hydrolase, partial [Rhodotorula sp. JG-1b]